MQIKNLKYKTKFLALALTTSLTLCGCASEIVEEENTKIEIEVQETFKEKLSDDYDNLTSIGIYYYNSTNNYNISGELRTNANDKKYITGRETNLDTIYRIIEKSPNLEEIKICSEQLEDVDLLTKITNKDKIKKISIFSAYKYEDLTFLNEFLNLEELSLTLYASDYSALNNQTQLETLSLTPLDNAKLPSLCLTNLKHLEVHNEYSDFMTKYKNQNFVDSIGNLTSLTTLKINDMTIKNFDFLNNLTNLEVLNLKNAQISDISALANIKTLTSVQLENNDISNITALYDLPELKFIDLNNNNIPKEMFDGLVERHLFTKEEANEAYQTQKNVKVLEK